MNVVFEMNLLAIQPSQLYISEAKLTTIKMNYNPKVKETLGIIPIKKLNNEIIFVDGHTRALAALLEGFETIQVEWESEDLDWEMYEICVQWCKDVGIITIQDLKNRIVSHDEYKIVWYERCRKMQQELEEKRVKI
jgi:hypothetical protein